MLISCPACPKMYRVPASAIPPEGREVSCSACGTVWFERGLEAEVVTVGAGAFSAASSPAHVSRSHSRQHEAPKSATRRAQPLPEAGHNVVALWQAPPSEREAELPPEKEFTTVTPESVLPDADVSKAPSGPQLDPAPANAASAAATEVSDFFNSEKWDIRLSALDYLKKRLADWRQPRLETSLNQGTTAAFKFREQIRARDRNRLTPMRCLGWSVWLLAAVSLVVVLSDRELVERTWPKSADAYAALFGVPEVSAPLRLENVTTRFALSVEGPVLEIRGTVVNVGDAPVLPLLELSVDGHPVVAQETVAISEASVPVKGERPFVVRAMVPEGSRRADIRLSAGEQTVPAGQGGFTLQRQGSGWGGATLPPLPQEALQTAQ